MTTGTLYICPTPLGNLEDITLRVLRILREADRICAEDTRHTRKLLSHFNIHKPLVSYHEHNKTEKTAAIITWLTKGEKIALVSDAGTPSIADPGEELVRAAIMHQLEVIALPGPVAAVTALSASGLSSVPFVFYGFLPPRGTPKHAALVKLMAEEKTTIFYESPHRLLKTLEALAAADPERQVVVARELTKIHEQYHRGSLKVVYQSFLEKEPRGECTIVLAGRVPPTTVYQEDPAAVAESLLAQGMSTRQAALEAARLTGAKKNDLYRLLVKKK